MRFFRVDFRNPSGNIRSWETRALSKRAQKAPLMVAATVEASLLAHAQRLLRGRPWARGELAAKLAAVCHRRRASARSRSKLLYARISGRRRL